MKIKLSFSRKVAGNVENLETLNFNEGDYYDIYNHMVIDGGFNVNSEIVKRQAGFKVVSINNEEIELEKVSSPICMETLKSGENIIWDFSQYGSYTISIA